ncbi:hypothetical protein KSP40_PGU015168 [Platanthera guangdongensis]|uniref:RING-type E3 ubiquitin transferase BRCA1 n=1 Tax=Platanthera guangdongensis TaxID=2320717 RepID=A0ABR2LUG2_9ASPA
MDADFRDDESNDLSKVLIDSRISTIYSYCFATFADSGIHPIAGMESVVATVSGYHGTERFKIIKLIACSSKIWYLIFDYLVVFARQVCWQFEGKKYNLARKLKTHIITHCWFEDCLKEGRRLPESPYTFQSGQEVGPISWKVPAILERNVKKRPHFNKRNVESNHQKALQSAKGKEVDLACLNFSDSRLLKESVYAYIDAFIEVATNVPGLSTDHYLGIFLAGLRPHIRARLRVHDLTTLTHAMEQAHYVEDDFATSSSPTLHLADASSSTCIRSFKSSAPPPRSPTAPPRAKIPVHRISYAEYLDLCDKGLYFRCKAPYSLTHLCLNKGFKMLLGGEDDDIGMTDFEALELDEDDLDPTHQLFSIASRFPFTVNSEPEAQFTVNSEPEAQFTVNSEPEAQFTVNSEPEAQFTVNSEPEAQFTVYWASSSSLFYSELSFILFLLNLTRDNLRNQSPSPSPEIVPERIVYENEEARRIGNKEDMEEPCDSSKFENLNSSKITNSVEIRTRTELCESGEHKDQRRDSGSVSAGSALDKQIELSCVICWTEFCSSRGVLPCGHRFCYSCIQEWSDCLSTSMYTTDCPLKSCNRVCFSIVERYINKAEIGAVSLLATVINLGCGESNGDTSDTFITDSGNGGRPTVEQPISSSKVLHLGNCPIFLFNNRYYATRASPSDSVCFECQNHEPEDLLLSCHICRSHSVHSCCLDPPLTPWTCIHCRDLRMLYQRFR